MAHLCFARNLATLCVRKITYRVRVHSIYYFIYNCCVIVPKSGVSQTQFVITILDTIDIPLHEIGLKFRSRQEDNIEMCLQEWDGKAWTGLMTQDTDRWRARVTVVMRLQVT
jgi:hypothetical protein